MQLIYYPNPILSTPCLENNSISLKDRRILTAKMFKIMNNNNGVGLAAPQVGLNIRMFVWNRNGCDHVIWNPVFSWISKNYIESIEGCLSLPGVSVNIKRAVSSAITGINLKCRPIRFEGNSIETQIWQHEIEHLDGKLITDNMSSEESIVNKNALDILFEKEESND